VAVVTTMCSPKLLLICGISPWLWKFKWTADVKGKVPVLNKLIALGGSPSVTYKLKTNYFSTPFMLQVSDVELHFHVHIFWDIRIRFPFSFDRATRRLCHFSRKSRLLCDLFLDHYPIFCVESTPLFRPETMGSRPPSRLETLEWRWP